MKNLNELNMKNGLKNAERQYSRMSPEARKILPEIVEKLQNADNDLSVFEFSPAWYVITHDDLEHKVQLEVEAEGSNLDIVLITPDKETNHYPRGSFFSSSSTKLTEGNVNFSVQRILAHFNLHDKTMGDDAYENNKVEMNNNAWTRVQEEIAFNKKFPENKAI